MGATTQVEHEVPGDTGAVGGRGGIVVLGAGVAGLVAAHELELLGHRVTVIEGSERVGGRIHTHRFGTAQDAPYAELGAMRIPVTLELTMRYVEKLGLKSALRPFRTILSDPNNYLATSGGFVRVREASAFLVADLRRTVDTGSYRRATLLFGAWLAAMVRAIGPAELRHGLAADLAELLPRADRIDLSRYLHGPGSDRFDLDAAFREHPELREGCGPRLYAFLDDLLLETGTGLMYLSGGMSRLVDRLAERVRAPILHGREVVSLHVGAAAEDGGADPDGTGGGTRGEGGAAVRVGLRHQRRLLTRTYPAVLCTLPFSVLRRLTLVGLDADKREVIGAVDYGAATKIALHCREAFWRRDGIHGGASAPGGRARQTYYPPCESAPSGGAALLASYAIAEDAHLLGGYPEAARHAAAVEALAPLHPELREPGTVLGAASVAWATHRWSRGCTSRRWQWGRDAAAGDEEMRRAARPQGRLFFAGEHCSRTPAWINGAIESALGAVAAVDGTLRRAA